MSRYVNLEGYTWDGTSITSKIQEVKTKYGYMQGITIGWLWGDNVPHIDLEEHDNQIRADERAKVIEIIHTFFAEELDKLETDYDGDDEYYKDTKKANDLLSLNKRLCERVKEQKE